MIDNCVDDGIDNCVDVGMIIVSMTGCNVIVSRGCVWNARSERTEVSADSLIFLVGEAPLIGGLR